MTGGRIAFCDYIPGVALFIFYDYLLIGGSYG